LNGKKQTLSKRNEKKFVVLVVVQVTYTYILKICRFSRDKTEASK